MTKTLATAENNLQGGIGTPTCGVFAKVPIHTNSLKPLLALEKEKLTLASVMPALPSAMPALASGKLTLASAMPALPSGKLTRHFQKVARHFGKVARHFQKVTLASAIPALASSTPALASLFVRILLSLSGFQSTFIKQVLNIKYSIYNVRGLHFNLDFLNFHKFKVLFIVFKLLFKQAHQYWCQPDYFNSYR